MKFLKRIVLLFCTVLILISSSKVCYAAMPFKDISPDKWYYDAVKYNYENGIIKGITNNTFGPDKKLTRAMLVTILWRMEGSPKATTNKFKDVKKDKWYFQAVNWANSRDIVRGYRKYQFVPEDYITREQMATILYRYSQYKRYDTQITSNLNGFRDRNSVSSFAKTSMKWGVSHNLIAGMSDGTLFPKGLATRCQAAMLMMRYDKIFIKGEDAPISAEEGKKPQYDDTNFVIHAAGKIPGGAVGSNSLEALKYTYQQGYRTIEIDFNWTTDNELVCVHDWVSYYKSKNGYTLKEFLKVRTKYGYTSLILSDIAQWMREHPDVYIVTDIKERNTEATNIIAKRYPDLKNRFIIQIYNFDEYTAVKSQGYKNIWVTLYAMPYSVKMDTAGISSFVKKNNIKAVVFPVELTKNKDYVNKMKKIGVPLYVHTVNSLSEQEAIRKLGIKGIYTDTGDARLGGW